jgi:Arc/MetJ family transcription regulator
MKRTNLVINEDLLDRTVKEFGAKTYSAAVNLAMEEALRVRDIQKLYDHLGNIDWQGDLSEMREDRPAPQKSRGKATQ